MATELVYQSEAKRIGRTWWRLQVMRNTESVIAPSVSGLEDFKIGTAHYTVYQFLDGDTWKDGKLHPRYDPHNGVTAGLPKGLAKLYEKHESIVKFWCNQFEIRSEPCPPSTL